MLCLHPYLRLMLLSPSFWRRSEALLLYLFKYEAFTTWRHHQNIQRVVVLPLQIWGFYNQEGAYNYTLWVVIPLQIRGFYNETSDLYKELKLFYPFKQGASTTMLRKYSLIPVVLPFQENGFHNTSSRI